MGLMPSALGMKRIRDVTVDLGRDVTCARVSSSTWPLERWFLQLRGEQWLISACPSSGGFYHQSAAVQPEGQVLHLGPDFLSVKADGVLLAHALGDEEAGANQADHETVQEPAQELGQDLRAVRELTGWDPTCEVGKVSQFNPNTRGNSLWLMQQL